MASLAPTDKALIQENGGILLNDGSVIRFDKLLSKPSRTCKKRLRELEYQISKRSGGSHYPYMEYIYRKKDVNP